MNCIDVKTLKWVSSLHLTLTDRPYPFKDAQSPFQTHRRLQPEEQKATTDTFVYPYIARAINIYRDDL